MAIAQDQTTWVAMSIFVAAQVLVLGAAVGTLPEGHDVLTALTCAVGVFVTSASFLLVHRSNSYMEIYWGMLAATNRPWFNVGRPAGPRAGIVISALHVGFYFVWGLVLGLASAP